MSEFIVFGCIGISIGIGVMLIADALRNIAAALGAIADRMPR